MDRLRVLYDLVDLGAGRIEARHGERLRCRMGCHSCCADDLSVFEVEAEGIRRMYPDLVEHGTPHAPGGCAFLDAEGGCRIYPQRPYVCRTQGLPLRWTDESDDGELVEFRDICPENDAGEPLESLDPDACWTIGPTEAHLAALQPDGRRALLRSLFARSWSTGRV